MIGNIRRDCKVFLAGFLHLLEGFWCCVQLSLADAADSRVFP
jgi:hypothetical protein